MKITTSNLRKIIREELSMLPESDSVDSDGSGDLSSYELRDIADDLESTPGFKETASEEAEKINRQAGTSYRTEQEYWEKMGISTGEDLAIAVLAQIYSDTYKSINGIRPRLPFSKMSIEQIQAAIKSLDDDWGEARHYEDQDWKDDDPEYIARGKALEAEYEADKAQRAEDEEIERMLTPEEGENEPRRMGMGRRPLVGPARDVRRGRKISENKMKITRIRLRQIIKEELSLLETDSDSTSGEKLDPNLLKGAYVSSKEDREAMKGYIAKLKMKKKKMAIDANNDGKLGPGELRQLAAELEDEDQQSLESFRVPYKGFGYGGRRIISRDRAWLEFVPKGAEPSTQEDMFRSVTLLDQGDLEVEKVINRGGWYIDKYLKVPVDNYDVYSIHATTTG